jgi:hypothetical protein
MVAALVWRIVVGELDETARRLLREMGYQAEGNLAPDVLPREAAENLALDPGSREYELALSHLVALGDIEPSPDPALLEQGFYRLTPRGLRRAREIRWR